jgi:hypothetical protein
LRLALCLPFGALLLGAHLCLTPRLGQIAALVLAVAAGVAPLALRRRLLLAGVVMLICGALACWILGTGALLVASRSDLHP